MSSVFEAEKLVVFVGAGVSALPPSDLPDWWGFNTLLLDGAKELVLDGLHDLPGTTRGRIASLSLDDFPVEAFSELLFDSFAGSSYFPVLGVLDGERPNANHFALVELARRGRLAAIVSTNFDTLIERAFRQLAVPLRVLSGAEDIEGASTGGPCTLFKIHGSVAESATLIDTVRQKLRGLPVAVRQTLEALFHHHPVLVLGYSGADLSFGDDYLTLRSAAETSPGIAWLVRQGTTARPAVREILDLAGGRGATVEGSLPEVFTRLGLDLDHLEPPGIGAEPGDAKVAQASGAPEAKAPAELVGDFYRQKHAGLWGAAAFCARLLERIGDEGHLRNLLDTLEARLELGEGPHDLLELMPTGAAMRNLATHALRRGEAVRARRWSLHELAIHRAVETAWQEAGEEMPPETATENARNRAGVWNNLVLVALREGHVDEARQALARSEHFASASDSNDLLAKAAFQRAQILQLEAASWETILEALDPAIELAARTGDGPTRLDALLLRAHASIALIEYDVALETLDQASQLLEVSGGIAESLRLALLRAAIVARRGDENTATEAIDVSIDRALAAGAPETALRALMAGLAQSLLSPVLLRAAHRQLSRLLLRMQSQTGSTEPSPSPTSEALRQRAEALAALDLDQLPDDIAQWLAFDSMPPGEAALRTQLARLEQRREHSVPLAECLQHLWRSLHGRSRNIQRLRDLAHGYRQAAERSGSPQQLAIAWDYLGITHDLAGELDQAIEAHERSLAIHSEQEPPARARPMAKAMANIALVKSRRGDEDAEASLRQAIETLRAQELDEDAFRFQLNLAEHQARGERWGDALATLETAAEKLADLPTDRRALAGHKHAELLQRFTYAYRRQAGEPWDEGDIDLLMQHPGVAQGPEPDREALARSRRLASSPEALANLGIVTMGYRHFDLAREMIEDAKDRFENRGDIAGISRCLNNLAAIEANEDRHEAAIALSREALALRRQIGDAEGQAITLSELARLHFAAGQLEPTIEVAGQCLALLDRQGPHRARLVSLTYLALALAQKGRWIEARVAARRRRQERRLVPIEGDPNIESILEQLAHREPDVGTGDGSPEAESPTTTAHRLSQLGLIDEALEMIEVELDRPKTPADRAIALGNKAHILNNAGRLEEARTLYLEVAQRFLELGHQASRLEAERQAARCTAALGEHGAAEARLRALLEEVPAGPHRGSLLRTLAGVIQQAGLAELEGAELGRPRFDTTTLELDAERLEDPELRTLLHRVGEQTIPLLEEAADMPGASREEQGIQRLNLGIAKLQLLEDAEGARKTLLEARPHLLAANSAHLALCDQLLESIVKPS